MKVSEVITGKEYLFYRTNIEHRKDMEGTIVTIQSRKKRGRGRPMYHGAILTGIHSGHTVFKITTGRKVSACELKEIDNGK